MGNVEGMGNCWRLVGLSSRVYGRRKGERGEIGDVFRFEIMLGFVGYGKEMEN